MKESQDFLFLVAAYLLGSIPTAVWLGKRFYGIDVREFGSGNAGATNTFRVLGKKAGIPVLLLDVLKGILAVCLVFLTEAAPSSSEFLNIQIALGVAALLGHIFPVFAGFRGGKGVATLLGVVIAIQPLSACIAMGVFLLVLTLSHYVSLSSMAAGISFPISTLLIASDASVTLIVFSFVVAVLLILTHKKNIKRLFRNQESKTFLYKRGKTA